MARVGADPPRAQRRGDVEPSGEEEVGGLGIGVEGDRAPAGGWWRCAAVPAVGAVWRSGRFLGGAAVGAVWAVGVGGRGGLGGAGAAAGGAEVDAEAGVGLAQAQLEPARRRNALARTAGSASARATRRRLLLDRARVGELRPVVGGDQAHRRRSAPAAGLRPRPASASRTGPRGRGRRWRDRSCRRGGPRGCRRTARPSRAGARSRPALGVGAHEIRVGREQRVGLDDREVERRAREQRVGAGADRRERPAGAPARAAGRGRPTVDGDRDLDAIAAVIPEREHAAGTRSRPRRSSTAIPRRPCSSSRGPRGIGAGGGWGIDSNATGRPKPSACPASSDAATSGTS